MCYEGKVCVLRGKVCVCVLWGEVCVLKGKVCVCVRNQGEVCVLRGRCAF